MVTNEITTFDTMASFGHVRVTRINFTHNHFCLICLGNFDLSFKYLLHRLKAATLPDLLPLDTTATRGRGSGKKTKHPNPCMTKRTDVLRRCKPTSLTKQGLKGIMKCRLLLDVNPNENIKCVHISEHTRRQERRMNAKPSAQR